MSRTSVHMPDNRVALKAMIGVLQAENEKMSATLRDYDLLVQALRIRIARFQKQKFGVSSAKIERDIEQLELALEDLMVATAEARDTPPEEDEILEQGPPPAEEAEAAPEKKRRRPQVVQGTPRERRELDPEDAYPDCGGKLRVVYFHPSRTDLGHVDFLNDPVFSTEVETAWRRPAWLRDDRADAFVLSANKDLRCLPVLIAALRVSRPVILRISSHRISGIYRTVLQRLMQKSNVRIAFTTEFSLFTFRNALGPKVLSRSTVLFHTSDVSEIGRPGISFIDRAYDFAFFGRLEAVRGLDEFMTFANTHPEYRFCIAGGGSRAEDVARLAEAAPNVSFAGKLTDPTEKIAFLSNAKTLLNLMRGRENFGISLLEAGVCGCNLASTYDYGPAQLNAFLHITFIDGLQNMKLVQQTLSAPHNTELLLPFNRKSNAQQFYNLVSDAAGKGKRDR